MVVDPVKRVAVGAHGRAFAHEDARQASRDLCCDGREGVACLPGGALAPGTFKFSTDPEVEAKVRGVVGLYVNPPANTVVLCVDEKVRYEALNRTQPILPVRAGLPERAIHDDKRHGTTSLFAAFEVATGRSPNRRDTGLAYLAVLSAHSSSARSEVGAAQQSRTR